MNSFAGFYFDGGRGRRGKRGKRERDGGAEGKNEGVTGANV